MGLSSRDRQALASIEGRLEGSDPRLASMLATFSRLAADEEMPARESIRAGRRRAVGQLRNRAGTADAGAEPGQRVRPRWRRRALMLWLAMTLALIGAALAASHAGDSETCATWSAACASRARALHQSGESARPRDPAATQCCGQAAPSDPRNDPPLIWHAGATGRPAAS